MSVCMCVTVCGGGVGVCITNRAAVEKGSNY